jgi:hypothetical protein
MTNNQKDAKKKVLNFDGTPKHTVDCLGGLRLLIKKQ